MDNPTNILGTLQQYDKNRQAHLSTELNNLENELVCKFVVTSPNSSLVFPIQRLRGLNEINWGDGTIESKNDTEGNQSYPHTYVNAGTYIAVFKGVKGIGELSFRAVNWLKEVYIGHKIQLDAVTNFYFCQNLEKITFADDSITTYTYAALQETAVKEVVFPKSCNTVRQFVSMPSIEKFVFQTINPPTLYTNAFENTNNCPIYVPLESLNAYKTATNWVAYADRIKAIVDTSYLEERLPTAPTTDGTYVLKVTVSSGTPLYEWVSES